MRHGLARRGWEVVRKGQLLGSSTEPFLDQRTVRYEIKCRAPRQKGLPEIALRFERSSPHDVTCHVARHLTHELRRNFDGFTGPAPVEEADESPKVEV